MRESKTKLPSDQQYSSGWILTVSAASSGSQLQGSETLDTTNDFVQTNAPSVCSIVNDGTAPSSGTCHFRETAPVLTNLSGSTIRALAIGAAGNTAAGPLIMAKSTF